MICAQRSHFILVYYLLVLLHVRETVNTLHDEIYRDLSPFNHIRHSSHTNHQHLRLQHTPHRTGEVLTRNKINHQKSHDDHLNQRRSKHVKKHLLEAVHAFHTLSTTTTTTTHRPHSRHKILQNPDNRRIQSKSPWFETHNRASIKTTTSRTATPNHRQRSMQIYSEKDTDDDYYYYDDERDEYEDDRLHEKPLKSKTSLLPETSDDFYNYLDDEPSNNTDTETGSLTEDKWRHYGTAEAVEKSRRRHLSAGQIVTAHITRVDLEAKCKYPRPRIIRFSEASKQYIPHCTVLHRCDDDTGCCHSDTQTCVAKKTETVYLHFYVISVGGRGPDVEEMSLINHTECHCVDRYQLQSSTFAPDMTTENLNIGTCRCARHFDTFEEENDDDEVNRQLRKVCRCDCTSENASCEVLKKGKEGFSVEDRRCISSGRCLTPACEYGQYSRRAGRCPRREDKLETARKLSFD